MHLSLSQKDFLLHSHDFMCKDHPFFYVLRDYGIVFCLLLFLTQPSFFFSYNVVLSNCTIGDFCVIHHGVCIGQDGEACMLKPSGWLLYIYILNSLKVHLPSTCVDLLTCNLSGRYGFL